MTNGFAMVRPNHPFDHTGSADPKHMFKSSEDPITASFISDSAGGCYVKADSFETFPRPNGHPGHLYSPNTNAVGPDRGSHLLQQQQQQQQQQQSQQQAAAKFHQQSSMHGNPDPMLMNLVPDFGHTSNNQHVTGYTLSHSYHSSSTLDHGAFPMGSPIEMNTSRQMGLSEANGIQHGMTTYGTQSNNTIKEPLLAPHHQPRFAGQTIYNQYTPRQSSGPTRYAGTLRSPSSLAKMKTGAMTELPGGSTLPRSSACITITNPALVFNGHETSSEFQMTTNGSLDRPDTNTPKPGGRSTQILSTGLAAFSTHQPQSTTSGNTSMETATMTYSDQSNQPTITTTTTQQLVSIKLADSAAGTPTGMAAPTSPLPSSFYNDASLEYALSSSCTPLLLSLDTATQLQFASPNPILMTADPNNGTGPSYSTGYYNFDGALTAAPILVQTPSPLTYTHLSTLGTQEDRGMAKS
ncbi:unnamed protein product [Echinostoma caproni]|uniref:BHLH domain-containing protein n=1 Tax=Echinostoma caproni TaxID=27848 RepID=A0A183ARF2_9TREM|nr:unnamed protein product [Echinostoma caproni]